MRLLIHCWYYVTIITCNDFFLMTLWLGVVKTVNRIATKTNIYFLIFWSSIMVFFFVHSSKSLSAFITFLKVFLWSEISHFNALSMEQHIEAMTYSFETNTHTHTHAPTVSQGLHYGPGTVLSDLRALYRTWSPCFNALSRPACSGLRADMRAK